MGEKRKQRILFSPYTGQMIKLGDHKPVEDSRRDLHFQIKVKRIILTILLMWMAFSMLWIIFQIF